MNTTQVEREARDILKIVDEKEHYLSLPEYRKTVAVSLAAVSLCARYLEYVPEAVISKEFEGREICRAALAAKDADCTILPNIPFSDVQKEGIQKFSGDTPAFILYSFTDIYDAKMAQDAVKADAYCIQIVPDKLLTKDLCRTALQSPNADEKVHKFVMERFPELKTEQIPKEEKQRQTGVKMKL
jgi:hypothetical protein